ncbi:MAG: class I SAM-dependent methyltransferase [Proteobacteria bacterium]|nr:class I SAM-dependent methyltransferase [Pseudomonadota bacterium]
MTNLKEEEIRPKQLFDQYLSLAEDDARDIVKTGRFEFVNCISCGQKGETKFEKLGFSYAECPDCQTIYANPRPSKKDLDIFYTKGKSTAFWATDFYRSTAEARREKLWKPKAQQVLDIVASHGTDFKWICDIGGGYGLFAEEFRKLDKLGLEVLVIEPSPQLSAVCNEKGIQTISKFIENCSASDLPSGPGIFTCFELYEHLHDPAFFLNQVFMLMPKNSVFIMTTLSGTGVDIRSLGKFSKSVFPPHHLNFANPKAIKSMAQKIGYSQISVSTPGKLDLSIMENSKEHLDSDFWKLFIETASEDQKSEMQNTLAKFGFSSHMWMSAIKK